MSAPVLVYHSGRQTRKFRFLLYFSLLCFLGALAGSYWIVGDPAMSVVEGWGLALLVVALGGGFLAGMLVYARRYVVRLWLNEARGEVGIETMRMLGRRAEIVPVAALHSASRSAGDAVQIRTPYLTIRVGDRRFPYVIDLQGQVADTKAFRRVVGRATRPPPRRRDAG